MSDDDCYDPDDPKRTGWADDLEERAEALRCRT
jgi:hypothetical protein